MDPRSSGNPAPALKGILRVPLNPYSGDPLIIYVPPGSPPSVISFDGVSNLCVSFPSPIAPPRIPPGYTQLKEIHPPLAMIPAPPLVEEPEDPLSFYDDSEDHNPNPEKDKLFGSTVAIFHPTLEDGLAPIGI
ncbi:hypothetical protein AMTR_s00040p00153380 [Amborella trichopoda]|uniref:Uncharacterized protein n=1 Tax=Amborella trichopoda TaxID=13333 RepID=W1PSS3_AMBTC|nr:hypothetical protein AMTR_s00040p00153380 [Amborella trichopoda]